jgi:hypothetical protein
MTRRFSAHRAGHLTSGASTRVRSVEPLSGGGPLPPRGGRRGGLLRLKRGVYWELARLNLGFDLVLQSLRALPSIAPLTRRNWIATAPCRKRRGRRRIPSSVACWKRLRSQKPGSGIDDDGRRKNATSRGMIDRTGNTQGKSSPGKGDGRRKGRTSTRRDLIELLTRAVNR